MAQSAPSSITARVSLLWKGLRLTLTAINILLALGMLGVYAIPWLDPRWFAPLALVGFLYYPLLAGLTVCGLIWIIRLNIRFWISLVVIVLGFRVHQVWWHWPWSGDESFYTNALIQGDFQKGADDGTWRWKVISYNVGMFQNSDRTGDSPKTISSSRDFLIKLLDKVQPDMAALQDFISWEPSKPDVLRSLMFHPGLKGYVMIGQNAQRKSFRMALDAELAGKAKQTGQSKEDGIPQWMGGMVMLTRRPVLNYGYENLGEPGHNGGMMWADILLEGDTLRWLNLHLASNRISPPELDPVQALEWKSHSSQRTIKGILRKIASSARLRAGQSDKVRAFMDRSPYPLLVTGDFNDLPYSFAVNGIRAKLKDSFVSNGKGTGNTYARGFPSFRIDCIMVDPQFPVESHEVIRIRYSDHYPVVAVLGR
jgi:endonuclease/exonuclease/phosphatase family metal-dependent hydrolase